MNSLVHSPPEGDSYDSKRQPMKFSTHCLGDAHSTSLTNSVVEFKNINLEGKLFPGKQNNANPFHFNFTARPLDMLIAGNLLVLFTCSDINTLIITNYSLHSLSGCQRDTFMPTTSR